MIKPLGDALEIALKPDTVLAFLGPRPRGQGSKRSLEVDKFTEVGRLKKRNAELQSKADKAANRIAPGNGAEPQPSPNSKGTGKGPGKSAKAKGRAKKKAKAKAKPQAKDKAAKGHVSMQKGLGQG